MSTQKLEPISAAETFRHRRVTPMQRAQGALHRHPEISPFIVLLVALVTFALASPRFLQPSNLSLILQQVAIVGSLAIGQTLVILTAGIDLSVGAIMILVTMVIGELAGQVGLPGWLSLLIGLGVGTGAGFASVYSVAGLICALSAWVLIGRVGAATPTAAVDANLDSITAVVIGGTSLFGGRGCLLGTFLGAAIVGTFRDGLALARLDVLYQTLAIALLIIASVSLDQWIRKVQVLH